MYLGDFKEDGDIFFKFTTRAFATGIPTQLANTPVLSVYIDEADGTEKTTGENYFDLDVDFDTITGLNNVRIDLSTDAFFATGADYTVVITTGTVGGVSVVGEVVATFSIENRSMGQPAGATLAADIATLKAETVLIVGDTSELQGNQGAWATATTTAVSDKTGFKLASDGADGLSVGSGTIKDIVDDTGELQVDDIPGTLATIAGYLDNEIAAILALLDDARGEPGDVALPVNPDLATKIDYLYKFLRNKIETTATKIHVYDDAGTNKDQTSTISDNGTTFTRGKFGVGDA